MNNIDEKYNNFLNNTQLSDDQISDIANQLDESIKGTELEEIAKLPSNNGQQETKEEDREIGELKIIDVDINPNSGEYKLTGSNESDLDETFEEMCERIQNQEIKLEETPITESEFIDYITNSDKSSSLLSELSIDTDLSSEAIKELLQIVNRKMNNEEFNVYKAFPQEIKNIIEKYMAEGQIPMFTNEGKQFRNMISEQLIQEFITNISIDRTMNDFNKEIEELFTKGTTEIADSIIGYTEERNQKYREYANTIEDEEKKEKINKILDQIDEANNLTNLIEFAKKCKIKKFDLEKSERVFDSFLLKYKNSPYNIYDIKLAIPILLRNINNSEEEYSINDVKAFFICFCKETLNLSPEDAYDHAYMYYVIYNIVLLDMNKGERKEVSDKFIENIKKVITNIKVRNNWI